MRLKPDIPWFSAVVWAWMMIACVPVNAQQDILRVLILNSYDESSAPYFQPVEEFKKELQRNYSATIVFQDVDLRQRGKQTQGETDQSIAQLLLSRYGSEPPQLVVATGPPAIDFWIHHRESTFPGALLVAMARESYFQQARLEPTDAVVATRFSFTGAVENILQLLPQTSHILWVFGDSLSERTLAAGARLQLAPYSDRLELTFTNDRTIPEIQDLLAGLPEGAVVFFGIFSKDINGVSLQKYSGLAMVRAASVVPVFGAFDDQLGHGIVGGRLIQVGLLGQKLSEAAQALLNDNHIPGEQTILELSEPIYDWRELRAWNIDRARLPSGSVVLFEPPGFWTLYANWIMGIAIVVLAQALLIATLLFQRRKRRKAEFAHASLGRRLITAHEDERRVLARELHDDLSQRLASVAIDAGFARSSFGTDNANEVLKKLHAELVGISKDVHDMSYRLHPSLVEDLGIDAALYSEIERVQRQTSVPISGRIGGISKQLPADIALCVFRIAQEALQNSVKHADASAIEIMLERDEKGLMLTIRDNGVGFNFAEVNDHFSLGLSSMRERATLLNGSLNIKSRPGEGTIVTFVVPIEGMTA